MTRTPPDIPVNVPDKDYAVLLFHHLDWWQEALNISVPAFLYEEMTATKERAKDLDDRGKATVPFHIGDEEFQMMSNGSRGKEFLMSNDDLRLEFGSPNIDYGVTWRATAAGLCEHGLEALRNRVYKCLQDIGCVPRTPDEPFIKLSRADVAFDIWSPAFTKEMQFGIAERVVIASGIKLQVHGTSGDNGIGNRRAQTLTIGNKGSCQVQIYDKTAEIVEASGKEWMREIWADNPHVTPEQLQSDV